MNPSKRNAFSVLAGIGKAVLSVMVASSLTPVAVGQNLSVDLSAYAADCGVEVRRDKERLLIAWPP